jgi:Uma2 family endonuclease
MVLLENLPKQLPRNNSEERLIITGVTWEDYESLLVDLEDNSFLRIAYFDGVMEIVAPSRRHESRKTVLINLLEVYFLETDTPYFSMGSTTLKSQYKQSGVEPDESYYLYEDKEIPDLAIEILVTSGSINRLELYESLGVREIWFWQKNKLAIYVLRDYNYQKFPDTFSYEKVNQSELLPNLDINLLQNCLEFPYPLTAVKEFRQSICRN